MGPRAGPPAAGQAPWVLSLRAGCLARPGQGPRRSQLCNCPSFQEWAPTLPEEWLLPSQVLGPHSLGSLPTVFSYCSVTQISVSWHQTCKVDPLHHKSVPTIYSLFMRLALWAYFFFQYKRSNPEPSHWATSPALLHFYVETETKALSCADWLTLGTLLPLPPRVPGLRARALLLHFCIPHPDRRAALSDPCRPLVTCCR